MEVHYDEGIASHIGPESCAGVREGAGEALTGEHTGQPLSRESSFSGCRLGQKRGRQYDGARQRECPGGPARSKTLACMDAPCTGTGRSPA